MSGVYIHIPFCKQACHYCDFHFSTSLKKRRELVAALCKEMILRKKELPETLETIYFGGGTPSLLQGDEFMQIMDTIYSNFEVTKDPEVTLEANPDDLAPTYLKMLAESPVNRLSIGVQSFFEADLRFMNRAHNSEEALECIQESKKYFDNVSIDLIYGIPGRSSEDWKLNLEKALDLDIPHISSYALTVESGTALERFIDKGVVAPIDEAAASEQYYILLETLESAGMVNYEFSNFGKPGYFSRNNTAYWEGKPYLGIGPSAHSFDGKIRSWNVRNNSKYIKAIEEGNVLIERELLTKRDLFNEYIMTGLRTQRGVSVEKVLQEFGEPYKDHLLQCALKDIESGLLELEDARLTVTKAGKFLSDGLASNLFLVN